MVGRRSLATDYKAQSTVIRLWYRHAIRRSQAVISNSEAGLRDIREVIKFKSPSYVIANALADQHFDRVVKTDPESVAIRIVQVANFRPYKNHQLLLRAVAQASRDSGIAFQIVFVGSGNTEASVRVLAQQLTLDCEFLGSTPDVRPILNSAHIVTLTSEEEGFNNSLMEAMAAGRPVIATDAGGNKEVLDGTGILVAPGDVEGLAHELILLAKDPCRRSKMSVEARSSAETRFSAQRLLREHLDIYSAIL